MDRDCGFNILIWNSGRFLTEMEPSFLCLVLFIVFCSSSNLVTSLQDSCSLILDPNLNIPFQTTRCVPIWPAHNLLLRYAEASANSINFVLSFPADTNAYVAIGFSEDGQMVGSSAYVAWIDEGQLQTQVYQLNGKTADQVMTNVSEHSSTPVDSTLTTAVVYTEVPVKATAFLIMAIGPKNSFPSAPNYVLTKHRDTNILKINYKTGKVTLISVPMLRRSHAWINIIGWSLLMMIGAIIARYCKQWDPLWIYLHISIQTLGFVGGVAGIICGFVLTQRVYVIHHRNIGILILILGCLQVIALVLRPRQESSVLRKYWNYCHHNVGRFLLIFALVNAFYGMRLGQEGSKWFGGYGGTLALLVIVAIILEIRMRMQLKTHKQSSQSQNNQDHELVGI